ncbi:hypothetical protein PBRA_005397, partial [Plasmodiophora brassicae]
QRFVRLLIVAKWLLRSVEPLHALNSLKSFISANDGVFRRYSLLLRPFTLRVDHALYPMWDVPCAVHLYSTLGYKWFPALNGLFEERRPVSTGPSPTVTQRLTSLVRQRLACEPVPSRMTCLGVSNGVARFKVDGAFRVALTLRLRMQPAPAVHWYVDSVDVGGKVADRHLIDQCNQELRADTGDDKRSERGQLNVLCDVIRRFRARAQLLSLKEMAEGIAKTRPDTVVAVDDDRASLDIRYWSKGIGDVPAPGHLSSVQSVPGQRSTGNVLRITLAPLSVTHSPPFDCSMVGIAVSRTQLSTLLDKAISTSIRFRLADLCGYLNDAASAVICWASLDLEQSSLMVKIFSTGSIAFPDGVTVRVSVCRNTGRFGLRLQQFHSPFWDRFLRLMSDHLNRSPLKSHHIIANIAFNAVIEHIIVLLRAIGYDCYRRHIAGNQASHAVSVRLSEFAISQLVIELKDGFNVSLQVSRRDSSRADSLDFHAIVGSAPLDTSKGTSLGQAADHLLSCLTVDAIRAIATAAQKHVIMGTLAMHLSPMPVVKLGAGTLSVRVAILRMQSCPRAFPATLSCEGVSMSARVDLSALGDRAIPALRQVTNRTGMVCNADRQSVAFSYVIGERGPLADVFDTFRVELSAFVALVSLAASLLSLLETRSDHAALKGLIICSLHCDSLVIRWDDPATGATISVRIVVIPAPDHTMRFGLHVLPRQFPQTLHLQNILNTDSSGLMRVLATVHQCWVAVNAALDWIDEVQAQQTQAMANALPHVDIVPESATCLRIVFRNTKMMPQHWIDMRIIKDNQILLEFLPSSAPSLTVHDRDGILWALRNWHRKCIRQQENVAFDEFVKQRPSSAVGIVKLSGAGEGDADSGRLSVRLPDGFGQSSLQAYFDNMLAPPYTVANLVRVTQFCRLVSTRRALDEIASALVTIHDSVPDVLRADIILHGIPLTTEPENENVLTIQLQFIQQNVPAERSARCVLRCQFDMTNRGLRLDRHGLSNDGDRLLGELLRGWDRTGLGSAIDILRRQPIVALARLGAVTNSTSESLPDLPLNV